MNVKTYLIAVFVAFLLFAGGFWAGVSYHPATDSTIRTELNHVAEQQQEIDKQIGSIGTDLKKADGLIEECIHIIRQVRCRPAEEVKTE